MVCGFFVRSPFLAARTGERKLCRLSQEGSRSSNPFELPPPFGSGRGGCSNPNLIGGLSWLNLHPPPRNPALEKLVDTGASADSEEPSGPQLSALLGLLNEKLMARIEAINATTGAVQAALRGVALHAR